MFKWSFVEELGDLCLYNSFCFLLILLVNELDLADISQSYSIFFIPPLKAIDLLFDGVKLIELPSFNCASIELYKFSFEILLTSLTMTPSVIMLLRLESSASQSWYSVKSSSS